MNARYYVPNTNRWLSPDTIVPNPTNPQSLNRYTYTLNSPVRFTDHTGHYATTDETSTCKPSQGCTDIFANYPTPPDWSWAKEQPDGSYTFDPGSLEENKTANYNAHLKLIEEHKRLVSKYENWEPSYPYSLVDLLSDLRPDAFILGASADSGGWIPSYTVGIEDLFYLDPGWVDAAAFSFVGPGAGHGASIDAGAYAGFVWNLDCVDCYSGDFSTLSVDFAPIIGIEINVFWAPEGDTWGFAFAPATGGISASITRYDTYYTRLDKP